MRAHPSQLVSNANVQMKSAHRSVIRLYVLRNPLKVSANEVTSQSSFTRQQQKALDHSRDLGTVTILHPYHPLYGQSFPILKIRKVDGQRRYSLRSQDDVFSVPESWTIDARQNLFFESYFDADTLRALLELSSLL